MDALHVSCDYSTIYEALSSVFLFDVVFSVGLLRAVAEHPFEALMALICEPIFIT